MTDGGGKDVRSFFGKHAEAYRTSSGHKAGPDLAALVEAVAPQHADRVLDVATGAGHTALSLLPLVGEVVALDITPEMGEAFGREMAARGLTGARFVVGDASALPFPDAAFTIVTCRRAAHHFPDKMRALAEMARVLAPGGRLALDDMTPGEGPGVAALTNRLETLRDASHAEAWTQSAWLEALSARGLAVEIAWSEVEEQPFDAWLSPVAKTPSLMAAFEDAIRGVPDDVRRAVILERDGARFFLKGRSVFVGRQQVPA